MLSCNSETTTINQSDYYSKYINKIISPNKTKFVEIFENGQNKNDAITQAIVEFGFPKIKGGSGIFAAEGTDLNIEVIWLNDNSLQIKYPKGIKTLKMDTTAQFINELVNIYFQEKLPQDSLP